MRDDALLLLGLSGAGLLAYLDRYRLTSKGSNPWTLDGLLNVLRLMPHFERIRSMTGGGRVTSVYRSEQINKAVGGAAKSDHLGGRAIDIVPALPLDATARKIYEAAERGELGPVRQVIREPSWIHVGWYPVNASGPVQWLVKT